MTKTLFYEVLQRIANGLVCSVFLRPDPLQGLAELSLAQGSRQFPPTQEAADPPDLKSDECQGDQTQLDASPVQVLHHACCVQATTMGAGYA